MADIATLGIAVDSSQVTKATTALTGLASAAGPAASGVVGVDKAAIAAAASSSALAKAATGVKTTTEAMARGTGLARHEMINLSRQIQDVGVSLASGQSPFMVLAQQGTQIADIFGSSKTASVGGALKQMGSGIARFLGPIGMAAVGITAVAGAGYLMYSSLKTSALAMDDLGKSVGATSAQLHGLRQAAGFKGIDADAFAKAMDRFGLAVYDAKNNMGGLAAVFQVNNASAKTFNDYLLKSADLIKNAKDDQTRLALLQQMGLPATMEWVRFLSQGADGIRRATAETVKFNESAEGKLVASARKFDEAWNKATTTTSNYLKSWALSAYGWLDGLITKAQSAAGSFTRAMGGVSTPEGAPRKVFITGGTTEPKSASTIDPQELARRNALEQSYIGMLGQTASIKQVIRGVDLQIAAYNQQPGAIALTEKQIETLRRLAAEQALGITQIKAATDAQRLEGEVVGMAVGEATKYAAAQNAINEARRAGRTLTEGDIARIQAEASALGQAAARTDTLRWSFENLVRGPLQTFQSSIANGSKFFDTLKQSGLSALNAITSKLVDMAAQNLWKAALGGGGGGLMSLLGLGGGELKNWGTPEFIGPTVNHSGYGPGDRPGPQRFVHAAYFDDAPRFHSGIGPGERAAIIRNDESVLTPGQMRQLSPGKSQSITFGDMSIIVQGSADDKSIQQIRRELSSHRQMLAQQAKAMNSAQRMQLTGVA